MYLYWGTGRNS